jgi:HK97 gp10 family phage protein
MTVTLRLEGSAELQAQLKGLRGDIRKAVSRAVVGTALELQGNVVKSVSKKGTGITYQKKNPNRTHTASAPDQPPATDTGRLKNSIEFNALDDLTATVGSKLAYATYLEYGTSRMANRPFFRPAIEKIQPKYQERLEKAINGATR